MQVAAHLETARLSGPAGLHRLEADRPDQPLDFLAGTVVACCGPAGSSHAAARRLSAASSGPLTSLRSTRGRWRTRRGRRERPRWLADQWHRSAPGPLPSSRTYRAERPAFVWLTEREVLRFLKIWYFTIAGHIISALLFVVVFGFALDGRVSGVPGIPFAQFILPGLAAQAMLNVGYINGTTSLFEARYYRYVNDVLASPLRWWEVNAALVTGGSVREALTGAGVLAVGVPLTGADVRRPAILLMAAGQRAESGLLRRPVVADRVSGQRGHARLAGARCHIWPGRRAHRLVGPDLQVWIAAQARKAAKHRGTPETRRRSITIISVGNIDFEHGDLVISRYGHLRSQPETLYGRRAHRGHDLSLVTLTVPGPPSPFSSLNSRPTARPPAQVLETLPCAPLPSHCGGSRHVAICP